MTGAAGLRFGSVAAAVLVLLVAVGCEPTLERATGVVVSVDSPALGRVDSFEIVTGDAERLVFDTRELRFRPEFPAAHLSEHMVLADPITVTYRRDGDRRIVTQLDDA